MFLRLDGLVITSAGPYMKRDGKGVRGRKGCQIDLLIQARRTICVVKIKRRCEIGRDMVSFLEVLNGMVKRRSRCGSSMRRIPDQTGGTLLGEHLRL